MKLYLILGVALAFVSLAGVAAWYRGSAISARAEAAQARADLSVAVAANAAQEATIGRLRASAEANDKLMAEMADTLDKIGRDLGETNEAIGELKDGNVDVKAYLDTLVPPDLRLLLDR